MKFFKQNPTFCSLCITALVIFAGASALLVIEIGKQSEYKEKIAGVDTQLKTLISSELAPTARNLEAARKNCDELNSKLLGIYENLRNGSLLKTYTNNARVVSAIQRYIINYQKRTRENKDPNDVPAPIQVPDNFAFGFEKYLTASVLPEGSAVSRLDKQRQILSYILDQLIASNPFAIQSVEREIIENEKIGESSFRIDPAASARVPGVIDTLAFRVTFTGYTPTLRNFLNNMACFQLPIVVRSVEVDRKETDSPFAANTFSSDVNRIRANQKPVVFESESIFTVTLEFIEVIEPPSPEGEPS